MTWRTEFAFLLQVNQLQQENLIWHIMYFILKVSYSRWFPNEKIAKFLHRLLPYTITLIVPNIIMIKKAQMLIFNKRLGCEWTLLFRFVLMCCCLTNNVDAQLATVSHPSVRLMLFNFHCLLKSLLYVCKQTESDVRVD